MKEPNGRGQLPGGVTRRRVIRLLGLAGLPVLGVVGRGFGAAVEKGRKGSGEPSLQHLLRRRHMVRAFQSKNVSREQVERLLDAAVRAPSAGNLQPWEFVVVRDAARRQSLASAAANQMWVAAAPVIVVACANQRLSAARYGRRGADFYSLIDTAFASLLLLLAVTAEGLGACFVGAFEDAKVKRVLSLPGHVRPVGVIPIGFPAGEPAPRHRKSRLRRRYHFEEYGKTTGE